MTSTMSSREFNRDVSKAKRDARRGPVFITDRGRPAHVLLTVEHYRTITDREASLGDLLSMPDAAEFDFDPPRLGDVTASTDLS
ncbi:MAG: type II toxin-antitoxin system Phd/YefM family antitoxin [Pseudomonadales bacterium]|nr:type II toxin-antitoxin system Phd/YefM family antitoxin [Pseudomonadales bacterium]